MQHRTLVVTVTPNPSLDLLFDAEQPLVWDDANRMADPRRRPGGQGINVARAVRALGGDAVAVALLGGSTGDEITRTLQAEGTPIRAVPTAEETRTFVALRDHEQRRSLLLNARGPARTAADRAALARVVMDELRERTPDWLACCGSVPAGFDEDFYASLARSAHEKGIRVVVDCDGPALESAVGLCDLLVPNQHEAQRLTGVTITTLHDAVRALDLLPVPAAAITLGAQGAVLRWQDQVWTASLRSTIDAISVGAGDCFLGALLMTLRAQSDPAHALRSATAAATASLLSRGADLLDPGVLENVEREVVVERAG